MQATYSTGLEARWQSQRKCISFHLIKNIISYHISWRFIVNKIMYENEFRSRFSMLFKKLTSRNIIFRDVNSYNMILVWGGEFVVFINVRFQVLSVRRWHTYHHHYFLAVISTKSKTNWTGSISNFLLFLLWRYLSIFAFFSVGCYWFLSVYLFVRLRWYVTYLKLECFGLDRRRQITPCQMPSLAAHSSVCSPPTWEGKAKGVLEIVIILFKCSVFGFLLLILILVIEACCVFAVWHKWIHDSPRVQIMSCLIEDWLRSQNNNNSTAVTATLEVWQ